MIKSVTMIVQGENGYNEAMLNLCGEKLTVYGDTHAAAEAIDALTALRNGNTKMEEQP